MFNNSIIIPCGIFLFYYLIIMANESSLRNRFFKLRSHVKTINMDIRFIQTCKNERLTPCFAKFNINHRLITENMKLRMNNDILRQAISGLHHKRSILELELYSLHLQLSKLLPIEDF